MTACVAIIAKGSLHSSCRPLSFLSFLCRGPPCLIYLLARQPLVVGHDQVGALILHLAAAEPAALRAVGVLEYMRGHGEKCEFDACKSEASVAACIFRLFPMPFHQSSYPGTLHIPQ